MHETGKTLSVTWHQCLHDKDRLLRHFTSVLTGEYRSLFTVTLCCHFPTKNMALDFILEFRVAQCLVPEYLIVFFLTGTVHIAGVVFLLF